MYHAGIRYRDRVKHNPSYSSRHYKKKAFRHLSFLATFGKRGLKDPPPRLLRVALVQMPPPLLLSFSFITPPSPSLFVGSESSLSTVVTSHSPSLSVRGHYWSEVAGRRRPSINTSLLCVSFSQYLTISPLPLSTLTITKGYNDRDPDSHELKGDS
ncbi:hypothetical protein PIB30_014045 [Stylosanthes scabra]|uniref:Uncharacterized protein n=1 Tax=Stylosanthes scabra TaxID=79078 RepID=A0ABU6Z5M1_9FABA|nr:hypothetical protein [Stylosanthes scabra]